MSTKSLNEKSQKDREVGTEDVKPKMFAKTGEGKTEQVEQNDEMTYEVISNVYFQHFTITVNDK